MSLLRQTLRTLARAPVFSLVVVLVLAVGIAANTVVFSLVDGTILNPFPYPEHDRLVGVGTVFPRLHQELGFWEVLSPAEYEDIDRESRTLQSIVAWDMGNRQISGAVSPTNVFTAFWWGDAFATLGVAPELGRGFLPEETARGDAVAVISHRLWESRWGTDPGIVGAVIQVNGNPYTVVGVMPPKTLIYGTDLWIPMPIQPDAYARNRRQFQLLARLAPGATIEEANTELEGIARRVESAYGGELEEYGGWRLVAATWTDINVRTLRPAALVLMGAVGLVLLLVCANLANLLLSRALRRGREFAVRAAVGARGRQILTQLLAESAVLAILGGAAGFGLSAIGIQALLRVVDVMGLPLPAEPGLNGRVLLFSAGVSMLSGLIFGLVPALHAAKPHLLSALQSHTGGSTGGRHRHRLQRMLVGIETAVALSLLVASGLLVNSLLHMQRVDPGFQTSHALTMRLTLPWEKYDADAIMVFFQELRERVAGLPGVRSAAVTNQFPPQVFLDGQLSLEGQDYGEGESLPTAYLTLVSPGYFSAMGIPLVRGRTLGSGDRRGAPEVALVNQAAARRFFGPDNPIGERFRLGGPGEEGTWIEIVGVVGDTRNRGLDVPTRPEIYGSLLQVPGGNQFFLVVRTDGDPRAVLPAIRETVGSLDPEQPVYAITTIDEAFASTMAPRRVAALSLALFAAFALLLASVGIYSVVAFGVSERTREIGLRMALGAEARGVRRLVVRQALVPVGIGASFGLVLAFGLRGFLESLLFGIGGADPTTFALTTLTLLGVAWMAAYVPARRATKLDAVEALRRE